MSVAMSAQDFASVQFLASLIHELAVNAGCSLIDSRDDKVMPDYMQLSSGLVLEMHYGVPGTIHTTLGTYRFNGGASGMGESFSRLEQTILNHPDVEMEMLRDVVEGADGQYGPTYWISRVGGITYPVPIYRDHDDFVSVGDAHNQWEELMRSYLATKLTPTHIGKTLTVKTFFIHQAVDETLWGKHVVLRGLGQDGFVEISHKQELLSVPVTGLMWYRAGLIK